MSLTEQILLPIKEVDERFQVLAEWRTDWRSRTVPIKKWSVQQLLDALDDQTLKTTARAEIDRRISSNKSTALVIRMLLPKSIRDADDAFKGLCKTCFVALGPLYFAPTRGEWAKDCDGLAQNRFEATKRFIASAIPDLLRPYFGKTEKQILAAALTDKFRHVPRAVKFDAIDAVRSAYRHMNDDGAQFVDLSYELGTDDCGDPLTVEDILARPEGKEDNSSLLSPPVAKARHKSDAWIKAKFVSARSRWVDLLGEPGWDTLVAAVEAYTRGAADGHLRDWKGNLSKAVAARRGVSLVQAQADLRHLRAKMSAALVEELEDRHKVPFVTDIWELFSTPGDGLPGFGVHLRAFKRARQDTEKTLLSPGAGEKESREEKTKKMKQPSPPVKNLPRRKIRTSETLLSPGGSE